MRSRTKPRVLLAGALVLVTGVLGFGPLERLAHAIIGRPLTPMSYAGVARRTTRRAVRYGAYGAPYGAYGAPYGAYGAPYASPYMW
jgi:hypothetical protein